MAFEILTSAPSPNQLIGNIDIMSSIISRKLSCGLTKLSNVIAVIAKPKNIQLPLYVPVSDAGVRVTAGFPERKLFQTYEKNLRTDDFGILVIPCFDILIPITYQIRKPGINFGNGVGNFSTPLTKKTGKDVPIIFKGDITVPCDTSPIDIFASGFNVPSSIPKISTPPLAFNFPDYGTIQPSTNMPFTYSIYINTKRITSGTVKDEGFINFDFGEALSTIDSLKSLLGKDITIRVVISFAGCNKEGTKTISLPPLCSIFETTARITPPSLIVPNMPLRLNISGIKQICKADSSITKLLPTGTKGFVTLGGIRVPFNITGENMSVDLATLLPISSIIR